MLSSWIQAAFCRRAYRSRTNRITWLTERLFFLAIALSASRTLGGTADDTGTRLSACLDRMNDNLVLQVKKVNNFL